MSKPHTVTEPLTVEAVSERAEQIRLRYLDPEDKYRNDVLAYDDRETTHLALYREVLAVYAADRTPAGDLARAALGAEG